jgi:hypothetical protein
LTVTSATESIDCVYIDADELVRMLSFWEPQPDPDFEWLLPMLSSMTLPRRPPGFTINDEPWLFTKDRGFHRVANKSDGSAPDPSPS